MTNNVLTGWVPFLRPAAKRLTVALLAAAIALLKLADAGAAQDWTTSVESPRGSQSNGAAEIAKPPAGKAEAPETAHATPVAPAPVERAVPGAPQPPPGSEPDAQSIAFGKWLLSCRPTDGRQTCDLSQTIRDGRNRRIVQLTVRKAGASAYMEVIVPVGISIPYGVSIALEGTANVPATLADCSSDGCRAVFALDSATLQKFKSSTVLAVAFQDSKSGKVISISGAPGGFEQGIAMVLAAP